MKPEKLKEILAKHKLWIETDGKEGERADLYRADLHRADLSGAYLYGAKLELADLSGAYLYGVNLERADLTRADLYGAKLEGANLKDTKLWGTIGNMREIKSLQLDKYSVTYTADRLQIVRENRSIEEWKGFSDGDIEMINIDLDWWENYREVIFHIIDLSPATPTGHERKE